MPTIRKKYCVEAVVRWTDSSNLYVVMVSVMEEDGKPVTSLTKSNFKAGAYNNTIAWQSIALTSFNSEVSNRGFYSFECFPKSQDPGEIFHFKENKDFTIEVAKEVTRNDAKTVYHGQCIASKRPAEVLEFA